MKIVYDNENKVAFQEIIIGDVFSHCGTLYISTADALSKSTKEPHNAINLDTGGFAYFDDNDKVTPVKAQIVIS